MTSKDHTIGMTKEMLTESLTVRIALYEELLIACEGPQPLLLGRRLLDLSDLKEWIAARMVEELLYVRERRDRQGKTS